MRLHLPFFQARGTISYIRQPGGGTFTIAVNGVVVSTVNTDGALGHAQAPFNMADAGLGAVTVSIEQTVAGNVDIVGPSYLASAIEPVFNNWSDSGRRLRFMSEAIIASLMAESSTLIMALGHNDQGDADSDNTYYAEFVQRIDWLIEYANQYNVKVVVPDFCWTAAESSRARGQLRRLANETRGVYVNLPRMIFSGGIPVSTSHLIDTLKMWTDGSHPNKDGHKWIAETVARAMGLSCCTKKEALRQHDFWMPIPLNPAAGIQNSFLTNYELTTASRRSGDLVLIRVFIKINYGGAFPVGTHALSTSFHPKSEMFINQPKTGVAYVRVDTGEVVSVFNINSGGDLTLNVLSSFITDQSFDFSAPSAGL